MSFQSKNSPISDSGTDTTSHARGRYGALIVLAVGALLVVFAYSAQLYGPFIFDDHLNIVDVEAIRVETLSLDSLAAVVSDAHSVRRPVANLSFALNHWAGGVDPWGYKVVNLLIHLATMLAAFAVLRKMFARVGWSNPAGWAAGVAVVWAVHPIHIQAVSYVVQRMTSLSALLALCAFALWQRIDEGGRPRLWPLVVVLWVAACLSKEVVIFLPLLAVAYRHIIVAGGEDAGRPRFSWREVALAVACMAGVALLLVGLTYFREASVGEYLSHQYARRDWSLWQRQLTQPRVLLYYLSLLVMPLPSRLSLEHDFQLSTSLFDPVTTVAAILFWLVAVLWALRLRRRHPVAVFSLAWFLLASLPEASILPIEMVFEHRMYLPGLAALVFLVWALRQVVSARAALAVAVAATLAFTSVTYARNQVWTDALTLWQDAASKAPGKPRPHTHLASELIRLGRLDEALASLDRAITADPEYTDAYVNQGVCYRRLGQPAKAATAIEKALDLGTEDPRAFNNLGIAYAQLGRLEDAMGMLDSALEHRPGYAEAHANRGNVLQMTGSADLAIIAYRRALEADPAFAQAHYNLIATYARTGQTQQAAAQLEQLRTIDPRLAQQARQLFLPALPPSRVK